MKTHSTSTAQPRVISTNNFSFLNKRSRFSENHFYISNDLSKQLVRKLLLVPESEVSKDRHKPSASRQIASSVELLQYWHERFSKKYGNLPPLHHHRLDALQTMFRDIVSKTTTLQPLLIEIENEYKLVIKALQNSIDEKIFLSNKIQNMLVHDPNNDALQRAKEAIEHWRNKWGDELQTNQELHNEAKEGDLRFVSWVGQIYTHELITSRPRKERLSQLSLLGRWQFIKDWVSERAAKDPIMAELSKKLQDNPSHFRHIFPEDEVYVVHDLDRPDVKKLKGQIVEQKRSFKISSKELELLDARHENLRLLNAEMDERIVSLKSMLKERFGIHSMDFEDS